VAPERMEWARDLALCSRRKRGTPSFALRSASTGVDLNPVDIPRMFEKFQDDESRTSRTGLGLALSRKFVQVRDELQGIGSGMRGPLRHEGTARGMRGPLRH